MKLTMKGVRLAASVLALCLAIAPCAVHAEVATNQCYGTVAQGRLAGGVRLPETTPGKLAATAP
ncbi:MAG: hypothetical protein ACJ8HI_12815 [Massilia sp.]